MKRRIGVLPDTCARPLFAPFRSSEFDLTSGTPGELAIMLRENLLDGAFLSPVDAVRGPSGFRIAPGSALVARGGSRTAMLDFREGLKTITTIAADPGRTAEIVLAHIIFLEKYGTTPRFIPLRDDSRDPGAGADAILRAGDEARSVHAEFSSLDLIEEWEDIAELPFVHGVWLVREGTFTGKEADLFTGAPVPTGTDPRPAISYSLDDESRAGLSEFLKMAFYHGILKEFPELKDLTGDFPR